MRDALAANIDFIARAAAIAIRQAHEVRWAAPGNAAAVDEGLVALAVHRRRQTFAPDADHVRRATDRHAIAIAKTGSGRAARRQQAGIADEERADRAAEQDGRWRRQGFGEAWRLRQGRRCNGATSRSRRGLARQRRDRSHVTGRGAIARLVVIIDEPAAVRRSIGRQDQLGVIALQSVDGFDGGAIAQKLFAGRPERHAAGVHLHPPAGVIAATERDAAIGVAIIRQHADGILLRHRKPEAGIGIGARLRPEAQDAAVAAIRDIGEIIRARRRRPFRRIEQPAIVEGDGGDLHARPERIDGGLEPRIGERTVAVDADRPDLGAGGDRIEQPVGPDGEREDEPLRIGEAPGRGLFGIEGLAGDIDVDWRQRRLRQAVGLAAIDAVIKRAAIGAIEAEPVDQPRPAIDGKHLLAARIIGQAAERGCGVDALVADIGEQRHLPRRAVHPPDRGWSAALAGGTELVWQEGGAGEAMQQALDRAARGIDKADRQSIGGGSGEIDRGRRRIIERDAKHLADLAGGDREGLRRIRERALGAEPRQVDDAGRRAIWRNDEIIERIRAIRRRAGGGSREAGDHGIFRADDRLLRHSRGNRESRSRQQQQNGAR